MSAPLSDTSVPVAEGDVIAGKYRVEKVLGQGAMGVVVAAKHIHLQQRFAIKFLTGRATREVVGRFQREAQAAGKLKNEHIARVIDFGELENGLPYLVMEYLSGHDLQQVLKAEGPLPIHEAVGYILQVCEAMAEAHSAGIVHRDLKPSNLFLTTASDGSKMVKVLDFGIAKAMGDPDEAEGGMSLTRTEAVLGSPLYMSIEQVRSSRDVDARTDVYSTGAILYQLLTGRVPFEAQTFPELILKLGTEDPPPPSTIRADIPPSLEEAILRCLERDRTKRFPNLGELAAALAPFALDEHIGSAERALRTIDKAGGPGSTTLSPAALRATRSSLAGTRTASSMSSTTSADPRAGRMKTIGLAALALVLGMASVLALVVFVSKPGGTAAASGVSGTPAGGTPEQPAPPQTALPSITPLVVPAPYEPTANASSQPAPKPTVTAAAPPQTAAPPPEPKPSATAKAPATTPPAQTPPPATTPAPAPTPTQKKNPLDIDIK